MSERDPNLRFAIRRILPEATIVVWVGSVRGDWVGEWGSRRLWVDEADARLELAERRARSVLNVASTESAARIRRNIKLVRVRRKPARVK